MTVAVVLLVEVITGGASASAESPLTAFGAGDTAGLMLGAGDSAGLGEALKTGGTTALGMLAPRVTALGRGPPSDRATVAGSGGVGATGSGLTATA